MPHNPLLQNLNRKRRLRKAVPCHTIRVTLKHAGQVEHEASQE